MIDERTASERAHLLAIVQVRHPRAIGTKRHPRVAFAMRYVAGCMCGWHTGREWVLMGQARREWHSHVGTEGANDRAFEKERQRGFDALDAIFTPSGGAK